MLVFQKWLFSNRSPHDTPLSVIGQLNRWTRVIGWARTQKSNSQWLTLNIKLSTTNCLNRINTSFSSLFSPNIVLTDIYLFKTSLVAFLLVLRSPLQLKPWTLVCVCSPSVGCCVWLCFQAGPVELDLRFFCHIVYQHDECLLELNEFQAWAHWCFVQMELALVWTGPIVSVSLFSITHPANMFLL